MGRIYKLNRTCKLCGKQICDTNKSGYCGNCYRHFRMFGKNNPFYGKTHTEETINILKKKCKIASETMWKDADYRNKVLSAVTGLKRTDEFKELQKIHAIEQFKDIKQHEIRSETMKNSWQSGKIISTNKQSINSSKQEVEFIYLLCNSIYVKQKHVIKYINEKTKRKKHLFPDGFIEELNIVIEFNGSYWHADPRKYLDENEIVHHKKTVKEIRNNDNNKLNIYKQLGYTCITVWSDDFVQNKEKCVSETLKQIEYVKNNR